MDTIGGLRLCLPSAVDRISSASLLLALPGSGQLLLGRNIWPEEFGVGPWGRLSTHRGQETVVPGGGAPASRGLRLVLGQKGASVPRSRGDNGCGTRALSALRVLKPAVNIQLVVDVLLTSAVYVEVEGLAVKHLQLLSTNHTDRLLWLSLWYWCCF